MAPDIPTAAESGLPGWKALGWFGLVASVGTPAAILARLNAETTAIRRHPDIRERIFATGNEPAPSTPEEFGNYIKSEIGKWARVIKEANVRVN